MFSWQRVSLAEADDKQSGREAVWPEQPETLSAQRPQEQREREVADDGRHDRTIRDDAPGRLARDLGRRGFLHVLCEGGLCLARSLAEAGLVDEWITVLASKVIGSRRIGDAVEIGRCTCLRD